jgi:hypothetical protein
MPDSLQLYLYLQCAKHALITDAANAWHSVALNSLWSPGYGRIGAGGGPSEQVQPYRPLPERADHGDLPT